MNLPRMSCYPSGSIVQRRNGRNHIKIGNKWTTLARQIMSTRLGRNLQADERVYHIDNQDRQNDSPDNLVIIRICLKPFKFLEKSKVIFIPGK